MRSHKTEENSQPLSCLQQNTCYKIPRSRTLRTHTASASLANSWRSLFFGGNCGQSIENLSTFRERRASGLLRPGSKLAWQLAENGSSVFIQRNCIVFFPFLFIVDKTRYCLENRIVHEACFFIGERTGLGISTPMEKRLKLASNFIYVLQSSPARRSAFYQRSCRDFSSKQTVMSRHNTLLEGLMQGKKQSSGLVRNIIDLIRYLPNLCMPKPLAFISPFLRTILIASRFVFKVAGSLHFSAFRRMLVDQ
jgi:hypothetical protein